MISMVVAVKEDYQRILDEHQKEVRNLVMAGLEQIKEGKTKDFNTVCDSLEQKYANAFFRGENDEKMEKDIVWSLSILCYGIYFGNWCCYGTTGGLCSANRIDVNGFGG